jgi:hypothetical protein
MCQLKEKPPATKHVCLLDAWALVRHIIWHVELAAGPPERLRHTTASKQTKLLVAS